MKRILILLIGLIVGLAVYSNEIFSVLNVDVPCKIVICKTNGYLVRVLDNQGKPSQNITWEVKDSVLRIEGYCEDENENTVVVFSPNNPKILVNTTKFDIRNK